MLHMFGVTLIVVACFIGAYAFSVIAVRAMKEVLSGNE